MISKIYYSITAFLIVITLVACELFESGFGDAVDLGDPVITIDSPGNGLYVEHTFTLMGTVTDDTEVKEVLVEYTSNVSGDLITENAIISDINWSLEINSDDSTKFKDGQVEFTVTGVDTADKETSKSRMVLVDNTVPTVLINTPEQYEGVEFNQKLFVEGKAEDLEVVKVEVALLDSSGNGTRYLATGTTNWDYTFDLVNMGLSLDDYSLVAYAQDAAGNVNEYFFHAADVLSLIENNKVATIKELADESNNSKTVVARKTGSSGSNVLISINPASDIPTISINDWVGDKNFTSTVRMDGAISDDDWLKSIVINVKDRGTENVLKSGTIIFDTLVKNYPLDIFLTNSVWDDFTTSNTDVLDSEGLYDIEIIATDGNEGVDQKVYTETYGYNIDAGPPPLEVDAIPEIENKRYVKGDFTITGNTTDTNGIQSVVIDFINVDDNSLNKSHSVTPDGSGDFTFLTSSDASITLSDAEYSVVITSTDTTNQFTEVKFESVTVDKIAPEIIIELPVDATEVNGIIELKGSTDDANSIQSVLIEYSTDAGTTWEAPLANIGSIYNWKATLDTTIINNTTISTSDVTFKVTASDISGRENSESIIFTVDQSDDIPVFTFTNIDQSNNSIPTAKNNLIESGATIMGTIEDDDKIDAGTLFIRIYNESDVLELDWTLISDQSSTDSSVFGWSHDFTGLSNGIYYFEVKATDIYGVEYISPASEAYFAYDTDFPVITVDPYAGGLYAKDDFVLSGSVTDGGGIQSLTISINGAANNPITVEVDDTWDYTENLDNALAEGTLTIVLESLDTYDKKTVKTTNYILDKTGPTIVINEPQDASTRTDFNGIITIEGSADDALSGILELYYSTSDTPDTSDLTTVDWIEIAAGKTWSQNVNTLDTVPTAGDMKITVVSVDGAGNSSSIEVSNQITLTVDQDADKPIIELTGEDAGKFSGNIVRGTVTDDDGVDPDSIKISFTDGSSPDGGTTWYDVETIGSGKVVTWSYQVLEANVVGSTTLWVKAIDDLNDKNGLVAAAADNINNIIVTDWYYPVIADFTILNDDSLSSINSETATLTFSAEITDDTGIINNTVELSYNSNLITITETDVVNHIFTAELTDFSLIPDGEVTFIISATDGFSKKSTQNLILIKDTVIPVINLDLEDNIILNGTTNFQLNASDAGGISNIEVLVGKNETSVPLDHDITWSLTSDLDLSTLANISNSTVANGTLTTITVADKPAVADAITHSYYTVTNDSNNIYLFNGAEFLPVGDINGDVWALDIVYIATDSSGNKSDITAKKTILIDEASDLPVLTLDNLTMVPGNSLNYFPNQRISGTVLEDDGVNLSSIKVGVARSTENIGDVSWQDVTSSASGTNATWYYDILNSGTGDSGDKKLWIKATDTNGISHTLLKPIEFGIDRESPSTTLFTIEGDNSNTGFSSALATGITVNATATDDYGIDSSSFTINFTDKNSVAQIMPLVVDSGTSTNTSFVLSGANQTTLLSLLADGETVITLTGYDEFLNTLNAQASIIKDITLPSLTITSGSGPSKVINQLLSMSGTITENRTPGVSSVNISLGLNNTVGTAIYSEGSWALTDMDITSFSDSDYSTDIITSYSYDEVQATLDDMTLTSIGYYKTTAPLAYYYFNGAEYISITNLWEFDADITITDLAGNVSTTESQSYIINAGTDIPVISLDNISKDSVATTLNVFPGQLIKGTISDDDGVSAATITVAITEPDVEPIISDWVDLSLTTDSSSVQWNYTIPDTVSNTIDGFFGVRDLHIKAEDINGNHIDHIRKETFVIDRDNPTISTFTIEDNNSQNYINSASTGFLNISADIVDDSLIENAVITYTGVSPASGIVLVKSGDNYSTDIDIDTLPNGVTKFTLLATDQFGKESTSDISILKDQDLPVVEYISPEVLTDINGIINIKGTTSDSNLKSIKLYDGITLLATLDDSNNDFEVGSSLYSWNYKLDTTGVTSGTKTIKIEAADINDNISATVSSSIDLVIDQSKDIPELTDVNSMNLNSGVALATADTYLLSHADNNNVIFGVTNSATNLNASDLTLEIDSVTYTPVIISGDGTISLYWYLDLSDFDDTSTDTDDLEEVEVIVVYDTPPADIAHYIGLRGSDSTTGQIVKYITANDKLSGYAEDDDKIDADEITLMVNGTDVIVVPEGSDSTSVKWSYGFDVETDGIYLTEINATDIKDSGYGAAVTTSTSYKSIIIKDTSYPVIDAKLKDTLDVDIEHQGAYVNGTIIAYGTATDNLSIKKFTITAKSSTVSEEMISVDTTDPEYDVTDSNLKIDGFVGTDFFDAKSSEYSHTSDNKSWDWEFALERLPDNYENSAISIIYEATDTVGNIKTVEKTVTVDTVLPVIDIQYPTLGAVVTGSVTIRGITTEEKMDSIQIFLGDINEDASLEWELLDGTYNWSKTINTVSPSIYEDGVEQGDGTFKYPVQVKAIDAAGNESLISDYYFYISPDLDKPTISVNTPEDAAKLGGSILMIGTATDNEAVDKVYVRVDVNGDTDYLDTYDLDGDADTTIHMFDDESTWNEISDFTNSVWKQEINSAGLLYTDKTVISIIENNGIVVPATGEINVQFKAIDIKGVESLLVTRNIDIDSTFPEITNFGLKDVDGNYDANLFDVSGNIELVGDIEDIDGGITKIEISYDGGVIYEPAYLWDEISTILETYSIDISKNSGAGGLGYDNSSDIINVRLKVTDNTGYQSFMSLQLNVDNILPVGTYTGRVDEIGISGGAGPEQLTEVSGTFQDTGLVSSFDKVEVYISQDGTVIDPQTGIASTSTPIDFNDGSGAVPYPNLDKDIITIDSLIEFGDDAGGNGDGDGYDEYISKSSNTYNWSAIFDSSSIDTDAAAVELHYVIYDNAGNANHYVEIMLIVGSDLDESGTIDEEEKMAYPQSFQARNGLLYIELFDGTKAGYNIVVTDTNAGTNSTATNSGITKTTINTALYPVGEVIFTIKVYDNAELKLTKTLNAEMKGPDVTPPTIEVDNLNSASVTLGHYDIGDWTSGTATDTNDLDISGKFQFTGEAIDDGRVKEIILSITDEVDIVLAQWVDGLFEAVDANMTITNQELHWQDGHTVNFTYDWDTATITDIANENRVVTFTVNDFVPAHTVTDVDQFDVVPYITEINRNGFNTNRSKLGFYPIRLEETGVIISGYNLSDGTSFGSITVGGTATVTSVSSLDIITNIPAAATSGYLVVTVNSISSINNSNNNNSITNVESNQYIDGTSLWTDDRYIHIWQSNSTSTGNNRGYFTGSQDPIHPSMTIDNTGILYGAWSNYALADVLMNSNNNNNTTQVFSSYDPAEHTDISFGNDVAIVYNANTYGNNSWTTWGAGGVELWDETNDRTYAMEELFHNEMLMQFINQRIVTNGTTSHIVYYDTQSDSLKYDRKLMTSGTTGEQITWINIDGYYDADDGTRVVGGTGSRTVGNNTGLFSSIDVTPTDGFPVISYYDVENQKLKLARSNSATPDETNWFIQDITLDGSYTGKYVSMKIDSAGYIHLVYYKTSTGDLIYLKSINNPTDGSAAYVFDGVDVDTDVDEVVLDEIGSVGMWADITLEGTTPIISYLDSSRVNTFDGLKVATVETIFDVDHDGSPDTVWETQNLPLLYEVDSIRTSIESDTGTNFWDKAIGYASSDYYRIAYYVP
ncbi:MAG: hypothetical protein OCD02_13130 [Spirochaetaceae bacterium]